MCPKDIPDNLRRVTCSSECYRRYAREKQAALRVKAGRVPRGTEKTREVKRIQKRETVLRKQFSRPPKSLTARLAKAVEKLNSLSADTPKQDFVTKNRWAIADAIIQAIFKLHREASKATQPKDDPYGPA